MYIKGKMKTNQDDLTDVYYIRQKVFQEEQKIPELLERDEYDNQAYFAVVYKVEESLDLKETMKAIATGRLICDKENNFKIGRIAVLPEERGKQYGEMIVKMLINKAFTLGANEVYVGAQTHAIGFYEKMGFICCGTEYIDLGKKHLKMLISSNSVVENCKNA